MSRQDSTSGYAYWIAPDDSLRVVYSLGVFHEIDFVVNEGYRRIPHGGIETGGLLFGTADASGIRIEAFRAIDCEHASGPSFVLSPRDLEELKKQLVEAGSDPELRGFKPLGWFVAHTRSALEMSDRELLLFNQLFPDSHSLAVLVKPERFQATRFSFLKRSANGSLERDGKKRALILPNPGQGSANTEAVPSLPAPEIPSPAPPVKAPPRPVFVPSTPPPVIQGDQPAPYPPETRHAPPLQETPPPLGVLQAPPPVAPPIAPPPTRLRADAPLRPRETVAPRDQPTRVVTPPPVLPPLPPRPTRPVRSNDRDATGLLGWRFATVLLLAAVLGCIAGYWCYLQLPSPVIPLNLHQQSGKLLIAWPAVQTSSVRYAAIRINDGDPRPLSPAEKSSGVTAVDDTRGDIKIELIAQHWFRDSRGIIRYVKAPKAGSEP